MLKMSRTPRRVTIFEGPDGSGKTTLAKKYAERTGALYVHFEAYYGVKDIYKFFIEAMQPALLGYQDVVLDRCWHSGPIYDVVFRNLEVDEQRQTPEICLLLDRAAAHCNAVLIKCLPDEDTCINNWKSRLETELVKSEYKMRAIHKLYGDLDETVILPMVDCDYTEDSNVNNLIAKVEKERDRCYEINNENYYVHVMVSSGAKTNADVMIDIPGVRFEKTTNEFKLAQMLGLYDVEVEYGNVTCEELIRYIPTDTDLVGYFAPHKHNTNNQTLIAIGEEAIAAAEKFEHLRDTTHFALCSNINVVKLYDIEADTLFRARNGLDSLNALVRSAFTNSMNGEPTNDGDLRAKYEAPSRPESVSEVGSKLKSESELDAASGKRNNSLKVVIEAVDTGDGIMTTLNVSGVGLSDNLEEISKRLGEVFKCDASTQ